MTPHTLVEDHAVDLDAGIVSRAAIPAHRTVPVIPSPRSRSTKPSPGSLLDQQRCADRRELVQAVDVAVAHPHAAVRGAPRDEAWLAGAVQPDDAAARPVRERARIGGGAHGPRAVERVACDVELLPDPELARR